MKKTIKTFAKNGDFLVDDVIVGTEDSPIPHGNIDLMVVSCFEALPPIGFFVMKNELYHYLSASLKTLSTFGMEASGKLIMNTLDKAHNCICVCTLACVRLYVCICVYAHASV